MRHASPGREKFFGVASRVHGRLDEVLERFGEPQQCLVGWKQGASDAFLKFRVAAGRRPAIRLIRGLPPPICLRPDKARLGPIEV